MSNQVHILSLVYDIKFHDADHGDSYAGKGRRILSVHQSLAFAQSIAFEFKNVVTQAERETVVFPVQPFNRLLKQKFGLVLDDISDGYNFKLVVDSHDVV